MKNLTSTLIALLVTFVQTLSAETPVPNNTHTECYGEKEVAHLPVGDETGKTVLTSKKFYRTCKSTYEVQGQCTVWDPKVTEYLLPNRATVPTIETVHTGSMGEALAVIGAMNQTSHMFNGVQGYCIYGTTQDFSWLEDPVFWASQLLSLGAAGAFGKEVAGSAIVQALGTGYAGCAVSGALDMASAVNEYQDSKKEGDCNNVDEFCGEEAVEDSPDMTHSLSILEYNTMIEMDPDFVNHITVLDDGMESGYVVFTMQPISNDLSTAGADIEEARQKAREQQLKMQATVAGVKAAVCAGGEAIGDIKEWRKEVEAEQAAADNEAALEAEQVALEEKLSKMTPEQQQNYLDRQKAYEESGSDNYEWGNGSGKVEYDQVALDALEGMAPGMALGMLPFPYGTIAQLAFKLFSSYDSVDSCKDKDDAELKGERHLAAYRGIKFNTCHATIKARVEERWPVTDEVMLESDTLCCYDSELSKILMVQMKSQTGRGWENCTGISLNDLSHMSWRQCESADRSLGVDGAKITKYGDMKTSYQFKAQCMDLGELKAYVESQVPVDFSETNLAEALERMNNDLTNVTEELE